jgi:hypothetical protein
MFSKKTRSKSIRKVSNDSGLSSSLLAGDTLQMSHIQYQPKSFFGNDDEETKSESTATVGEEETFESVGFGWDLVIIIPIPQQEEIGKLERSHEHDEVVHRLNISSDSPLSDHHGASCWRIANLSLQFHPAESTDLQSASLSSSPPDTGRSAWFVFRVPSLLPPWPLTLFLSEYILQYDPDELQNLIETGVQKENGEHLIKPTHIKHDPTITTLSPFEYIFDTYSEGLLLIPTSLHLTCQRPPPSSRKERT